MPTTAPTPEFAWLLGATLIGYVVFLYALSFMVRDRIADSADFLVAGRRLPLSFARATLLAAWFDAGTLLTCRTPHDPKASIPSPLVLARRKRSKIDAEKAGGKRRPIAQPGLRYALPNSQPVALNGRSDLAPRIRGGARPHRFFFASFDCCETAHIHTNLRRILEAWPELSG